MHTNSYSYYRLCVLLVSNTFFFYFQDVNMSWNAPWNNSLKTPDVPYCCQVSIFVWLPLGVFTLLSIVYTCFLATLPTVYSFTEKTKLNVIKIVSIILLYFIQYILIYFNNIFHLNCPSQSTSQRNIMWHSNNNWYWVVISVLGKLKYFRWHQH